MNALQNILKRSSTPNTCLQMLRNAHSSTYLQARALCCRHRNIPKARSKSLPHVVQNHFATVEVVRSTSNILRPNHVVCHKKAAVASKASTRNYQYSTFHRFFDKFKFWKTADSNKEYLCAACRKVEDKPKKLLVLQQTPKSAEETSSVNAIRKDYPICSTCGGQHMTPTPSHELDARSFKNPHNLQWKLNFAKLEQSKCGKLVPERPRARTTIDLMKPQSPPWNPGLKASEYVKKLYKSTETINKEKVESFVILSKKQLEDEVNPVPPPQPRTVPPVVYLKEKRMILKLTPKLDSVAIKRSLDDLVRPTSKPSASKSRVTRLSKFPFHCDSSCNANAEDTDLEWLGKNSRKKLHTSSKASSAGVRASGQGNNLR